MIYRFDEFELDLEKCELRRDGGPVHVEPQVFALLHMLVENHDRVVTKDEIIEKIWEGRFVSEAAVSSRIRAVRRALGDAAKTQRYLRTHYKHGIRFQVTPTLLSRPDGPGADDPPNPLEATPQNSNPTIAILPFVAFGELGSLGSVPDAFPHDLIVALSQLRWLSVVARGSSFRFRGDNQDIVDVGKVLGVSYCLTGSVETTGQRVAINIELSGTADGQLVWAEHFAAQTDQILELREQIVHRCLVELELQISRNEARPQSNLGPASLDAWSSFHTGLQLYYRFNRADNDRALLHFEHATHSDDNFGRAHAARSGALFQKAFYQYDGRRQTNIDLCKEAATRAVEIDPFDPFANYAMGRVFWLTHEIEESAAWFDQATEFSPSHSQGHYACSWTQIVLGQSGVALDRVEIAMKLSPLDPLLASMQWIKACALLDMGEIDGALHWSEKAARSPRATIIMPVLAAVTNEIAGRRSDANFWSQETRSRNPSIKTDDIFQMMPFRNHDLRRVFHKNLDLLGF